jgi:hypothetical protein
VLDEQGVLIRFASQATLGKILTTRLSDGAFTSRVEKSGFNKAK